MPKIEEFFSDPEYEWVVYYLKQNNILTIQDLSEFNFDTLYFVPGLSFDIVKKTRHAYSEFLASTTEQCGTSVDVNDFKQDALIQDVFQGVPRADRFVMYCIRNGKEKMSQLTGDDIENALKLRGLGEATAQKLRNIYFDFCEGKLSCATNPPENFDFLENIPDVPITKVFCNVPKGRAFINYCKSHKIKFISELKRSDFDARKIGGIGRDSMDRIFNVFIDFVTRSSSIEPLLNPIHPQNMKMSISILSALGVPRRIITSLKNEGYTEIGDLETLRLCTENQVIEKTLTLLSKPAGKVFDYAVSLENEENVSFLKRRIAGETLQEISNSSGLTRERVRQRIVKTITKLLPIADAVADTFLSTSKQFFYSSDLIPVFSNLGSVELCKFVLLESSQFTYLAYADKFVDSTKVPDDIEEKLAEFTSDVIGIGINYYDSLEVIEDELKSRNLSFLDFLDIMNYLLKVGYRFYGDYAIKGKPAIGLICRDVVAKYFPKGIKLDANEANEDMGKLRSIINSQYPGLVISESNRALTARLTEYLVLSGRGQYIAIENIIYNLELFKEIFEFIVDSQESSLYYSEIFYAFKGRLLAETNISNKHFLHGMLKYLYPHDFNYKRDLLVKRGTVRTTLEDRISALILAKRSPVTKKEIFEEIPGTTDIMISMATVRDPKLIQWEVNTYNHISNIKIEKFELDTLIEIIKAESKKFNGYLSEGLLYQCVSKELPAFISTNQIRNSMNLFYVLSYYCSNLYLFKRPHIISKELELDNPDSVSIAKMLLHYEAGINYMDYVALVSKLGWADATIASVFNALERDCIRISENDYIDKRYFQIDEQCLMQFREKINDLVCSSSYFPVFSIFDFSRFPECDYEWNEFLVASVINSFIPEFKLIAPQAKDRRYVRDIIIKVNSSVESFEELVAEQLLKDGYLELSEAALEKYLKNKGLIIRTIPQELYDSELFIFRNERFFLRKDKVKESNKKCSRD